MSTKVEQPPVVVAMSRPQIGIDRLPTRRVSNEPREAMNCKSCRKRKVGRPSATRAGSPRERERERRDIYHLKAFPRSSNCFHYYYRFYLHATHNDQHFPLRCCDTRTHTQSAPFTVSDELPGTRPGDENQIYKMEDLSVSKPTFAYPSSAGGLLSEFEGFCFSWTYFLH